MDALLYFVCFTLACFIPMYHSQGSEMSNTSKTGLSNIGCMYFGRINRDCCGGTDEEELPITNMPSQCGFYIWDGATVDWTYSVTDRFKIEDGAILDTIIAAGSKVFLNYGYSTMDEWVVVLACNGVDGMNARDEMVGLKAYLGQHKNVMGLMLKHLEPDEFYKGICGLTEGLITYLGVIKEELGDMKIGLRFMANYFMDYYTDSKLEWLNFEEISPLVDLIVIDLSFFNLECTPEFRDTSVPISGNADYTLEKLKIVLEKSKIPYSKIYIMIPMLPGIGDLMMNSMCDTNYVDMCMNPDKYKDGCADSTKTLYEKGVYFKEMGVAGIIVAVLDMDDPTCVCKCSTPFPGFYALVEGFNCNPPPPPCPLYDRC